MVRMHEWTIVGASLNVQRNSYPMYASENLCMYACGVNARERVNVIVWLTKKKKKMVHECVAV